MPSRSSERTATPSGTPNRNFRRRTWRLGGFFFLVAVSLVTPAILVGCKDSEASAEAISGTRLGMSPRDVRERFSPGSAGSWQTSMGSGDDTILEWHTQDPSAKFKNVRFEFHLGMLVAARAEATNAVPKESIASTPKTVTVVRPSPEGGSTIDILARDCPTHHDEAEALVAKAH